MGAYFKDNNGVIHKIALYEKGGGGHGDTLERALNVFSMSDTSTNDLKLAWEDYKRTPELKYDLNLTFELTLEDFFDVYSGDSVLTQLYNDCVNEVIQVNELYTIDSQIFSKVGNVYQGDMSSLFGWPAPLYLLGLYTSIEFATVFLSDLTPFGMGVGISLLAAPMDLKFTNIKIFKQYENYEQGLIADLSEVIAFPLIRHADFPLCIVDNVEEIVDFAFYDWSSNNQQLVIPNSVTSIGNEAFFGWESNNQPLVIPDSVTSIGEYAFAYWTSNNQPLTIPNSVTSIGSQAFENWTSNNQPLTIPNSVTSIGNNAFFNWTSNNQPLIIPNSVTSIGNAAFYNWSSNNQPLIIPNSITSIGNNAFYNWSLAKEFIMESETPPTITSTSFNNTNNAPFYVPDESVDDYKTATNWVELADRIFPISEKP